MAEFTLVGSNIWPTVKAAQNGDGTGTFWVNSFIPLFERLHTIASYLREDFTIPTSGASLDTSGSATDGASLIGLGPIVSPSGWAGGTLRAFLVLLFTLVDELGYFPVTNYEGTDADQALSENDRLVVITTAETAARTYALSNPTRDGRKMHLIRESGGTFTVTVTGTFGQGLTGLSFDAPGAIFKSATLISWNSTWYVLSGKP